MNQDTLRRINSMTKSSKELVVETAKAQQLEAYCEYPPGDCGRGEAIFDEEVVFEDGRRVAIQVIASENPEEEMCWTQGVLFSPEGNELACTDVGEAFIGEFELDYDGDQYEVIVCTDMRDKYQNRECPDCGEPISRLAQEGESCDNCGHVWWVEQPIHFTHRVDIHERETGQTIHLGSVMVADHLSQSDFEDDIAMFWPKFQASKPDCDSDFILYLCKMAPHNFQRCSDSAYHVYVGE